MDCAAYANYALREPAEVAAACGSPAITGSGAGLLSPTDMGYAQDIGYISDNFVSFPLGNFTGQTVVGTSTNAYYAMDFDPSATTLYAINDTTDMLGTIDLATGAFTPLVSCPPGGGAGTTQTNLGDAAWVMVHEAGHYLFGLGDEYVGGGNWSISVPKNVFSTQSDCESNSVSNSLPSSQCVQIGSSGTWRNDDGQATTMEDRQLGSDWRTLSGRAMGNLLSSCVNGTCY